jgi:hypothetical protein
MRKHWPNREGWESGDRFNASGAGGHFLGGRAPLIKSVQRGTIVLTGVATNTATITSVSTADSMIKWLGESSSDAGVNTTERSLVSVTLTNGTTVTATRTSATSNATVSYEVIEFNVGYIKSVARSTVTGNGGTATITAVDTTRTMLECTGLRGDASNFTGTISVTRIDLTNSTTITNTASAASGIVVAFQTTEFNP